MKNKKGFIFSISVIILLVPLIIFISSYNEIPETKMGDTISRSRCDKLHYSVEDIKKDLERVISISGRRAAIAAVDDVINSGEALENYTFNCSSNCAFDCSDFIFQEKGGGAAIAELITCGTLHGLNASIMSNHTLSTWVGRITNRSKEMNFNASLKLIDIKIVMRDAWSFSSIPVFRVSISDMGEKCFYKGIIKDVVANSSIIGLIDPLYPLKTYRQIKHYKFRKCPIKFSRFKVIGESSSKTGDGSFTGTPTIYSDLPDAVNYCQNKIQSELEHEILVYNQLALLDCNMEPGLKQCFNKSSNHHFGGLIAFQGAINCNPTTPYIVDTGDIENISNETCVHIINEGTTCEIHQVLSGVESNRFNTTCYEVSDIEDRYNNYCTKGYSNGPSFLDRLEGNLNLSSRYVKKTEELFNRTDIGLESVLSPFEIMQFFNPSDPRLFILLKENASWIDYLYWQNISGCQVMGSCGVGVPGFERYFKLDCAHTFKYKLSTSCISMGCCPAKMGLNICQLCDTSGDCSIRFNLTSFDVVGNPLNLTSLPKINISGTIIKTNETKKIGGETGKYTITLTGFRKVYDMEAVAFTLDPGCPTVTNSTYSTKVDDIPSC